MNFETDIGAVKARLKILHFITMLAFILIALALVYWSVIRGPSILARDDNPRLVEKELRIFRGSILDANNVILAETSDLGGDLQRVYPVDGVAPVVGYYSLRHGTSGIESSFDNTLRGEVGNAWSAYRGQLLHESQVGNDVQLTIDARLQQLANSLLEGEKGAILLFSIPDNEILAIASQPSFDPNELDENFERLVSDEEAPLLNRAMQGQYQPGMVIQPFVLASAIDTGDITLDGTIEEADDPIRVNGSKLQCIEPVNIQAAWSEILQKQCPRAMAQLANQLGVEKLKKSFGDFGFLSLPESEIEAEVTGGDPVTDIQLAGIGQDTLSVSPMQIGMALAALANGGEIQQPRLVLATQNVEGKWITEDSRNPTVRVVALQTAEKILDLFAKHDGLIERSATVLSGPYETNNAWYLGLIPGDSKRYGVVVVLEDHDTVADAQRIGRSLLIDVRDN